MQINSIIKCRLPCFLAWTVDKTNSNVIIILVFYQESRAYNLLQVEVYGDVLFVDKLIYRRCYRGKFDTARSSFDLLTATDFQQLTMYWQFINMAL